LASINFAYTQAGIRPRKHERAAVSLSGYKAGEAVLVVGELSKNGITSMFTEALIKNFGNSTRKAPSEIAVTHPVDFTSALIHAEMANLHQTRKLKMPVGLFPYTDISKAVETYDRIFLTTSMGDIPETDTALISAWKNRNRRDNSMVHLKGNPLNQGLSNEAWTGAGLDNFVPPEAIRAEMMKRGRDNRALTVLAEQAADLCAQMRMDGRRANVPMMQDLVKNSAIEGAKELEFVRT